MKITIKTNNQQREIIDGYCMPMNKRGEFDWMTDDDYDNATFFEYKGQYYYLGDFLRTPPTAFSDEWHAYLPDSFFSGVLIRVSACSDYVIAGTYCS